MTTHPDQPTAIDAELTVRQMVDRAFGLGESHCNNRLRAERTESWTVENKAHAAADRAIDSINALLDQASEIDARLTTARPERAEIEDAVKFGMISKVLFPFVEEGQAKAAVEAVTSAVMAVIDKAGGEG